MANKLQFASDMQQLMTALGQQQRIWNDLYTKYFSVNGYSSEGTNQIIDADVASLNITAAQIANGINLIGQLQNLMSNQVVTQGVWQDDMDDLRTDE